MKDYVLDANAILRFFKVSNAEGGEKVRVLLEQAQRHQARVFMSAINVGEMYYTMLGQSNVERTMHNLQALQRAITIVEADLARTIEAAELKHKYHLAYADSFAASLALSLKATLVSADTDFEKMGKQLKWMKLPKYTGKTR
jgi:predicted nucleic acid-binding protein